MKIDKAIFLAAVAGLISIDDHDWPSIILILRVKNFSIKWGFLETFFILYNYNIHTNIVDVN